MRRREWIRSKKVNPASERLDTLDCLPSAALGGAPGGFRLFMERERDSIETNRVRRRGRSDVCGSTGSASPCPVTVPVPASPFLSVQALSRPSLSLQLPPVNPPFRENCTQLPALVGSAELSARKQFKGLEPVKEAALSTSVVDTRWAPAAKMVGSKEHAEARPAAKGYQDPDLKDG